MPSATSAVASLSRDSPSRIVTIRRGSPILRPIAVAATASGGATTAPIARAIAHETPGRSRCATSPTPNVVNATSPTDSNRIGRLLTRKSTSEVPCAAAYRRGGSSPNSTTSSESSTSGTIETYDATTPTRISRNGAGMSTRSATQVHTRTPTARPQSSRVMSTAAILPMAEADT